MGKFKVPRHFIRKEDRLTQPIKKDEKPAPSEILKEKLKKLKLENLKMSKKLNDYIGTLRVGGDASNQQQDVQMALADKQVNDETSRAKEEDVKISDEHDKLSKTHREALEALRKLELDVKAQEDAYMKAKQ